MDFLNPQLPQSRPLNIGVDARFLSYSDVLHHGIGRYTLRQLAETVRQDRYNHYLLFTLPGTDTNALPELIREAENVNCVALPEVHPTGQTPAEALRVSTLYQEFISRYQPDVFHSTTPLYAVHQGFLDFRLCPVVVNHYDLIPLIYESLYLQDARAREMYLTALNLTVRQAEWLLVISRAAAHELVTRLGIDANRIHVAPCVPEPIFKPLDTDVVRRELARLSLRLGIEPLERYFLAVSALHPTKNLDTLLQAFAALPEEQRDNTPLVLTFGLSDGERDQLEGRLYALGIYEQTIITGRVSDDELVALYNGTLALVHPSRHEGFGLPVIEAMACGAPVITTNVSALPEVAGDAGWLLDPDDVEAFTQAMHTLVHEPDRRAQMSQNSMAQSQKFVPQDLGKHTREAYFMAAATRPTENTPVEVTQPVPPPEPQPNAFKPPEQTVIHEHPAPPHDAAPSHQLRALFDEFDEYRLRSDLLRWSRVPVLGFFVRVLLRIRNIGLVWGAQFHLLNATLDRLNDIDARLHRLQHHQHDADRQIIEGQNRQQAALYDTLNTLDQRLNEGAASLQQMREQVSHQQEQADESANRLGARLSLVVQDMLNQLKVVQQGLNARVTSNEGQTEKQAADLQAQMEQLRTYLDRRIDGEILEKLQNTLTEMQSSLAAMGYDSAAQAETFRQSLENQQAQLDDLRSRQDETQTRQADIQSQQEQAAQSLMEQLESARQVFNERIDQLTGELSARIEQNSTQQTDLQSALSAFSQRLDDLQRAQDEYSQVSARQDEAAQQLAQRLETAAARQELHELDERLATMIEAAQQERQRLDEQNRELQAGVNALRTQVNELRNLTESLMVEPDTTEEDEQRAETERAFRQALSELDERLKFMAGQTENLAAQLRLNTGTLRLVQQAVSETSPQAIPDIGSIMDYVASQVSTLNGETPVYVSMAGVESDSLLLAFHNYFGTRLQPLENSPLWLHVDLRERVELDTVFDNALESLKRDQHLAVIVGGGFDVQALEDEGELELVGVKRLDSLGQTFWLGLWRRG